MGEAKVVVTVGKVVMAVARAWRTAVARARWTAVAKATQMVVVAAQMATAADSTMH